MIIKRVSKSTIQVDDVLFDYNVKEASYVSKSLHATNEHHQALNRFLLNENPSMAKEYDDFFRYVRDLKIILLNRGICSEL